MKPPLAALAAPPDPPRYWEERARRYAGLARGLAAVCSYGMPDFHNAAIDLVQRRALEPWLELPEASRVLDLGCGIGRWSRWLARRGALVTGVDLAPTMLEEAARRARLEGSHERLSFRLGDVRDLRLGERFDLVLAVTVLQHLLDAGDVERALETIQLHLAPGGRIVLLEAAPSRATRSCDTAVFQSRSLDFYRRAFLRAGLELRHVGGVDPAPFRRLLLPRYRDLPRPLALLALGAATALSLPIDLLAGRRLIDASWHKLFVLERAGGRT